MIAALALLAALAAGDVPTPPTVWVAADVGAQTTAAQLTGELRSLGCAVIAASTRDDRLVPSRRRPGNAPRGRGAGGGAGARRRSGGPTSATSQPTRRCPPRRPRSGRASTPSASPKPSAPGSARRWRRPRSRPRRRPRLPRSWPPPPPPWPSPIRSSASGRVRDLGDQQRRRRGRDPPGRQPGRARADARRARDHHPARRSRLVSQQRDRDHPRHGPRGDARARLPAARVGPGRFEARAAAGLALRRRYSLGTTYPYPDTPWTMQRRMPAGRPCRARSRIASASATRWWRPLAAAPAFPIPTCVIDGQSLSSPGRFNWSLGLLAEVGVWLHAPH